MPYDAERHIKEVFAHFGLAVSCAQVLEHGLVNALVYLKLIPARAGAVVSRADWENEVDSFLGRQFQKTLGTMISSFSSVTAVPAELSNLLSNALTVRNRLAHDYFRDRAVEFTSRSGRDEMIAELDDARRVLDRADRELDKFVKPIRDKYGLTEEKMMAAMREMRLARPDSDPLP